MDSKLNIVRNKKLDNCKALKAALRRKNSLAVSALVGIISKGGAEKAACERLNINYKLFRYLLDKDDALAVYIKDTLGKARAYSKIREHEATIRKTKRAASKL